VINKIEHDIQVVFFKACAGIPGCEWMHAIPNAVPVRTGGLDKSSAKLTRIITQNHMTSEGRKPGVLDVFNPRPVRVIERPWRNMAIDIERTLFHGLYIEFKRPTSVVNGKKKPAGQLKPEQAEFILYAAENGYAVAVCYSAQGGVDTVLLYMRGEHDNGPAVELARKRLKK
jgi:hypothetical protein